MFFALADRAVALEAPSGILIDSAADLQIDHSGNPEPSDSFDIETITNNDLSSEGACDGDDPVAQGLTITLGTGSCASSTSVFSLAVPPFSGGGEDAHSSLKHHKHGAGKHKRHFTLKMAMKATDPSTGETETANVDAEITVLPTPAGSCGQWKLDAEVSQVDLGALTANPVGRFNRQGDDSGCKDQIQAQFCNDDNQGDDNSQGDEGWRSRWWRRQQQSVRLRPQPEAFN